MRRERFVECSELLAGMFYIKFLGNMVAGIAAKHLIFSVSHPIKSLDVGGQRGCIALGSEQSGSFV